MEIEKYPLPSGWRWATLGEVCPARVTTLDPGEIGDGFTYIDISAVDSVRKEISEARTMASKDAPSRARQLVRAGDVLVSGTRPNLNAVARVRPRLDGSICSTGFSVLRPGEGVDGEYLFSWVRSASFVHATTALTQGALYPAITDKQVRQQKLPLPPLPEQRRIVAALQERRAAVEAAQERVADEIELCFSLDKKRVDASFASIPAAATARGWKWVRLRTIIESTRNGLYTPDENYGSGTPILKMFNIGRFTGKFDLTRLDRVSLSDSDLAAFKLEIGDIVVNRVNSAELVAKSALVTEREAGSVFESKNIRLRVRVDAANPFYVCSALNNEFTRRQIFDGRKQIVGMATIDRKVLGDIEMGLPPLRVQDEFVDRIILEAEATRVLRDRIGAQLADLAALDAALLRAAFAGAL